MKQARTHTRTHEAGRRGAHANSSSSMDAEAGHVGRRHDGRDEHDDDEAAAVMVEEDEDGVQQEKKRPMELPADLPRSLDDRQSYSYGPPQETEYYDAWQGASTTPLQ